jgi:hypothetical protein
VAQSSLGRMEPLSPPPTVLSDSSAPSTIEPLSGLSMATEKAGADDSVPVPHESFYYEDGSVVFLVSTSNCQSLIKLYDSPTKWRI